MAAATYARVEVTITAYHALYSRTRGRKVPAFPLYALLMTKLPDHHGEHTAPTIHFRIGV
jgi:hypothetical protein